MLAIGIGKRKYYYPNSEEFSTNAQCVLFPSNSDTPNDDWTCCCCFCCFFFAWLIYRIAFRPKRNNYGFSSTKNWMRKINRIKERGFFFGVCMRIHSRILWLPKCFQLFYFQIYGLNQFSNWNIRNSVSCYVFTFEKKI